MHNDHLWIVLWGVAPADAIGWQGPGFIFLSRWGRVCSGLKGSSCPLPCLIVFHCLLSLKVTSL